MLKFFWKYEWKERKEKIEEIYKRKIEKITMRKMKRLDKKDEKSTRKRLNNMYEKNQEIK